MNKYTREELDAAEAVNIVLLCMVACMMGAWPLAILINLMMGD